MKKIVFPAFELSLGGRAIFVAVFGVAILLSFMIFIVFLSLSLNMLVYNTAVLLALMVTVTIFVMFLEYSIFLTDIFRYIICLLSLLLKGFEEWTTKNIRHINLSSLSILDLLIIFTLLTSIATKTILNTESFYGLNGITVFLLVLSIFSTPIIIKAYKDYSNYYPALNHILEVNEDPNITDFLSNFLKELLEHSKSIFIVRFSAIMVTLELFTLNVLNDYTNNLLPILELFLGLSVILILYLTFKTTMHISSFQQPEETPTKKDTTTPKKEEFQEKEVKATTSPPSPLKEDEKKFEENKQPQTLRSQLVLPIGRTTAEDKEEEKEFKVDQKKPLIIPQFPISSTKKNFRNIKVVKVEDIEEKKESEISKLVEEIKGELKKLREKSKQSLANSSQGLRRTTNQSET